MSVEVQPGAPHEEDKNNQGSDHHPNEGGFFEPNAPEKDTNTATLTTEHLPDSMRHPEAGLNATEEQKDVNWFRRHKKLTALGATGAAAAAVVAFFIPREESGTVGATRPSASSTPTPGGSTPVQTPPAVGGNPTPETPPSTTAPSPSETGGLIERQNSMYVEANVPESMLSFDFLEKYKADPDVLEAYAKAIPGFTQQLFEQEGLAQTITVDDIYQAKQRIDKVIDGSYLMVKDGKLVPNTPANEFFDGAGFLPGRTMKGLERVAESSDEPGQVIAAELFANSNFVAPAVDRMAEQSDMVAQHLIEHPEDAGVTQSSVAPEDIAMMGHIDFDNNTVLMELSNAGLRRPTVKDNLAYIAHVYKTDNVKTSPDGSESANLKLFTLVAETDAKEVVVRLVAAVPLKETIKTDPATFETTLENVEGDDYFQLVEISTEVYNTQ